MSHIMYMDDAKYEKVLIQTIRMYSEDIGMELGIAKRFMFIMKKGKKKQRKK